MPTGDLDSDLEFTASSGSAPEDARAEWIVRRNAAWTQLQKTDFGRTVLEDLARICRPQVSPYHPDPWYTAIRIGEQDVWRQIQRRLEGRPS